MKIESLIAACAVLLTSNVFAQSSVTLYGVVEAAVVSQNNANPEGGRVYSLEQAGEGFLSASRIGFLGTEDLGGGNKAHFVLENGFTVNSGKFDQQGQLFGRQAYVGLLGKWGELNLGRQYTGAVVAISTVDPIFIGAPPTNSWLVFLTGQRYDNAVTYTKKFGPVGMNLQYALGGIAGHSSARSSMAGGLSYDAKNLVMTGELQQTRDTQSRTAKTWSLGAKYTFGLAALYADYMQSQRDPLFDVTNGGVDPGSITNMSTPANATTVAAIGSVFKSARRDQFFTLGANYYILPSLVATGAFMYDDTTAVDFGGARKTAYAVLDYFLSKRTDVYIAGAFDKVNGNWSGLFGTTTTNYTGGSRVTLNGHDTQLSYYIGLRHKF
jgi:predicted porin